MLLFFVLEFFREFISFSFLGFESFSCPALDGIAEAFLFNLDERILNSASLGLFTLFKILYKNLSFFSLLLEFKSSFI